jgi:hypothetical protein
MLIKTHYYGLSQDGRRCPNLKIFKLVHELLDNLGRMRIIGKHIKPHLDLVHEDRSFTTEQRLTSETPNEVRFIV